MKEYFNNLITYNNSIHQEEAYKIIQTNTEKNNKELSKDIEIMTRYIYDLERRLDEISYMKFKKELLFNEET